MLVIFTIFAVMDFKLTSEYRPTGDQPEAIAELTEGVNQGMSHQTLLGVTVFEIGRASCRERV